MSCAASAKKITRHRFLSILIIMILSSLCACLPKRMPRRRKAMQEARRHTAGKSKKQSGAKSEEKKDRSRTPAGTEKAGGANDGDQEEAKGPWHGLTWRLVGPYRGGRVLAVSGVVGDTHTYYFGGAGGGYGKPQTAD